MVISPGTHGPAVSRAAGQRLARGELSKSMYHPGVPLAQRIAGWIGRAIDRILNSAGVAGPGISWWAVVGLAALVVLTVAAIMFWVGPVRRSARRAAAVLPAGQQLSARDHRQRAERMAAAGDFTGAVIESLRAIAAELEERGVLPPRPGRTADELAAEASAALPGHVAGLRQAARLFDDIMYGGRDGTADSYRRLHDLDAGIRAARTANGGPVPASTAAPLSGAAAGPPA